MSADLYRVAQLKRPEFSHGIMQKRNQNKWSEKHISEQTFPYKSKNFCLNTSVLAVIQTK